MYKTRVTSRVTCAFNALMFARNEGKMKEKGVLQLGFNTLNKKNEGKKSFNLLHFCAHKCLIKHT